MHTFLPPAILIVTLGLVFVRPRGLHEAWATCFGAALMLALGLETLRQALAVIERTGDVLAFLFALMLLSALLDRSGFFTWAAILAARAAGGDGRRLYRNVFLLGACTTALLSLDTTAIILTPIVLGFVQRLKLSARPFLLACAFVANTASLLLPVSNLTNLLFAGAFHLRFGAFALRMALPQCAAVAINYLVFAFLFRRELPRTYDSALLPSVAEAVPDTPYFRGALLVLGCVSVGYFFGSQHGVPPYIIAFGGCLPLLAWGKLRGRLGRNLLDDFSLPLFPFLIGLLIVVQGVQSIGLAHLNSHWLSELSGYSPKTIALSAFGAGLGANLVNNIPMALLCIGLLQQAHAGVAAQYGALLGCNLGPNLTLAGSLATMLVIGHARKKGEDISAWEFLRAGLCATPLMLLAGAAALWLVLCVWH